MRNILKIIIFIAFIYIIGHLIGDRYHKKGCIPKHIMKYFKEEFILGEIGDLPVTYLEYKDNNLDPERYVKSTVKDFLKLENTDEKRQQIKQAFKEDEVSQYFLKYGYYPAIKHFNIKKSNPFVIRISNSKWTFDYHYDCMELLLFQLSGTRVVYLKNSLKSKKERRYILNPGDTLLIPIGVYHRVETYSGLNINFNIILEADKSKIEECNKKFSKDYKKQFQKCKTNHCI